MSVPTNVAEWLAESDTRRLIVTHARGEWHVRFVVHGRIVPGVNEVEGEGDTLDDAIDDAWGKLEALVEIDRAVAHPDSPMRLGVTEAGKRAVARGRVRR